MTIEAKQQVEFLNDALASAVETARASVLGVERRRGPGTTAVVWNDQGLLVAANHALVGDSGSVILEGGERRDAEVIGRDSGTDLALLRTEPDGLRPLSFGDPGDLAVGHLALALGRPGRVIRASLRAIGAIGPEVRTPGGGRLEVYLESDRPLSRGFSGGPLIDLQGRAFGINTNALFRGASVAVPRPALERVIAELEAHGTVRRGFLGVAVQRVRLPAPVREELGRRSGALVVAVEEKSPAQAAGLVLGDVLVELGGEAIEGPDRLRLFLHERRGEKVSGRILRAGALTDVEVSIGERGGK